jgi:hypothetical protein
MKISFWFWLHRQLENAAEWVYTNKIRPTAPRVAVGPISTDPWFAYTQSFEQPLCSSSNTVLIHNIQSSDSTS